MGRPLSIRLSADEREALERAASKQGVTVSALARRWIGEAVGLSSAPVSEVLEDHERRISRLEEMAGL